MEEYVYEKEKAFVFTDEGQRAFLKIRDETFRLIEVSGAVKASIPTFKTGICGLSWSLMACFDRLAELGEIREVTDEKPQWQDRVFVLGPAKQKPEA